MNASFQRMKFPSSYVLRPEHVPCALDSLVALDATLRPIDGLAAGIFPIGCNFEFVGWAIAAVLGGHTIPSEVLLGIDGTSVLVRATLGLVRDDVARDRGDLRLSGSGFRGLGSIGDDTTPGSYGVSLFIINADRTYNRVAISREVEIAESNLLFPRVPESNRTTIAAATVEVMHGGAERERNRFRRGAIIVARGEATDRDSQLPASRIFAIVDGSRYYAGVVGLPNERGERQGFSIRIPTQHLAPGPHALRIAAVANDGTSVTFAEPTPFELRSP